MTGLRLTLDAEVLAGNHSHFNHTLPGWVPLPEHLVPDQRPYLVRGDCGFGNDRVMRE